LYTRNLALSYAHEKNDEFLAFLEEFIKIPSISTSPENAGDMLTCAEFLSEKLRSIGIENITIFPTARHPIVYGDYLHAGENRPTVLVYGHYDVQPVDPVELWNNDPFLPVIKNDNLYARGASDMKGQVVACLAAIESVKNTGNLPVNLKFIFEGEEEIGSPSLNSFLIEHKELLKSTIALNPDTGMINSDLPTMVYGLRGLSYFEVRIFGPDHDLHSGVFGGVVHNPAQVLCDLISKMHDEYGKVTLPHFYDDVLELTDTERSELARLKLDDEYYRGQTGTSQLWGERGYTSIERVGARPTLEVNGILSGFTGVGAKTIIPAKAMAKISTRLVPNQEPKKIYEYLVEFFKSNAPDSVRWEIEMLSAGHPSISDLELPETRAMRRALEQVWGMPPVFKREGGSVPVVADMQQILGIDSVLTGFGLPDDNIHSPNEKLHLPTWKKGIDALINFLMNIGEKE
jgi:acetylornithine deacetylase/succinyl-diaminopimelate desuccinylase-like protein